MFLRSGFSIGRLFGIQLYVDASLFFIFALIVVSLGASVFPAWHPEWSAPLSWFTALAAAVLFFGSVIAHELSHALVARRHGIPVRRITLFLFGGIANIEHEPPSPRVEALMAIVGPLASLAIGFVCLVLAAFTSGVEPGLGSDPMAVIRQSSPLTTLFVWLGPVNLLLGLFNLVPGFPLDGGRVLRAFLWQVTGSLRRATRWASRCGQLVAWLLIAAGIAMAFGVSVPVFGRGVIPGLWLAFIGWFLNTAAVMSYQQLLVREILEDVPVSRVVRREQPPAVPLETTLDRFVDEYAMQSDSKVFPVLRDERVVAVIAIYDVRTMPLSERRRRSVGSVARPLAEVPTLEPNQTAYDALRAFGPHESDFMVVVDAGEFVGFVQREDIGRFIELHASSDAEPLSRGLRRSDLPAE